ncbi:MAG: thioredoxin family protein [Bacteroidota bacterium]|nr:thioredoxin family protein [Bacteroidota bacterium]
MKKIIIANLILLSFSIFSQTKQIVFETGNFESALKKAQKENKLVFIDAFTTWCGPCKKMSKEIFTNDSVANYFNKNFVNYKFDMEKGEGIEFAKKYQVQCYPNLLVLDSKGNVMHRGAGYMKAEDFIVFAKTSFSSDENFISKKNYYENTNLTQKTLLDYISLMEGACLNPSEIVAKYLKSVKEEELSNETNWSLIRDNITDLNSREIKYLIKNHREFELKYNVQVEDKISNLGLMNFSDYFKAKELDKIAFEKSKQDFLKLNWPYSDKIIFETELTLNSRFNKPAFYEMASKPEFITYNTKNANALNSMAWTFYEEVIDKKQLEAACKMAKHACELENTYANLDTYAAVLFKVGNYKEAEIQAEKAIERAKIHSTSSDDYKETTDLLKKIKAKQKG